MNQISWNAVLMAGGESGWKSQHREGELKWLPCQIQGKEK